MARGQNLLNKIYNKPLLISLDELQPIADYLSSPERVASLKFEKDYLEPPKLEDFNSDSVYQKALYKYLDINPETMTGVLNIDGVLVNREGKMNAECVELTSYQGLKKRFEMQVDAGVKDVVLMVSSGGGEAFGAWSTANYIKKVAKDSGVTLTTYVNGMAASAAYVWSVVSDKIISHPMSQIGSIGVLVQLYNDSKMLDNMGIERSFVYAGGNKIPFDKDGGFTDKFISDLQKSVDKTYEKFVAHVTANRDLSAQQVIDTQASTYDAEDALALGLVDEIMELEDFEIKYGLRASRDTSANSGSAMLSDDNKPNVNGVDMTVENKENELLSDTHVNKEASMQELTQLKAENEKLSVSLTELQASVADYEKQVEELNAELGKVKQEQLMSERKLKLEDALGKDHEKLDEFLLSTATLSDEAFHIVASTLSSSQESMQASFTEHGDEGQDSDTHTTLSGSFTERAKQRKNKA